MAHRQARRWLRGQGGEDAPMWLVLMTLADGDPLRAQEMEQQLSAEWLAQGIAYVSERNLYQEREVKKRGKRKIADRR